MQRSEDRDRCRQDRRLGILGQVEAVGRPVPGQYADRLAKGAIGRGEDRGSGRRGLGEGLAHPDGLGALARAHELDLTHTRRLGVRTVATRNYHAWLHMFRAFGYPWRRVK